MKNKEKYDLSKLKTDSASCGGKIKRMMVYEKTSSGTKELFKKQYRPLVYPYELLIDFANWLEQEYVPKILDEKEKAYLSAIIKPFRDKKIMIGKLRHLFGEEKYIWIDIDGYHFTLPHFKKGEMYKGMELNKFYTSEELGL